MKKLISLLSMFVLFIFISGCDSNEERETKKSTPWSKDNSLIRNHHRNNLSFKIILKYKDGIKDTLYGHSNKRSFKFIMDKNQLFIYETDFALYDDKLLASNVDSIDKIIINGKNINYEFNEEQIKNMGIPWQGARMIHH